MKPSRVTPVGFFIAVIFMVCNWLLIATALGYGLDMLGYSVPSLWTTVGLIAPAQGAFGYINQSHPGYHDDIDLIAACISTTISRCIALAVCWVVSLA